MIPYLWACVLVRWHARRMRFARRRLFFDALWARVASHGVGSADGFKIAWPDGMVYLRPVNVMQALTIARGHEKP